MNACCLPTDGAVATPPSEINADQNAERAVDSLSQGRHVRMQRAGTVHLYPRPQFHKDQHIEPALYAQECSNKIRTALSHLREAKEKRKTPGPRG